MFPPEFVAAVNRSNLIKVSAGAERTTSLEIWVVCVDGRLFARSWGLSERSWFSAFINGACGFLECERLRVNVSGRRPLDLSAVSARIDAEYLRKYDNGANSKYAHGILAQQHVERTLEFIPATS